MTDKNIEKVQKLIDEDSFEEAENLLLKIRRSQNTSYINYLLGYIHYENISSYSDFNGSKEDAIRYLNDSIDGEDPIDDGFCILADIEDSQKQAIRILRKGLVYYPNNERIYRALIKKSNNSDIPEIYKEIERKKIKSNIISFQLYKSFENQKKYDFALEQIGKIKLKKKIEIQLLDILKAFCFYELKEIPKAKKIFNRLIEEDVSHRLNYSQYIGLLLCFLELEELDNVIEIINELPNRLDDPFVFIHQDLNFQFFNYLDDAINQALTFLKGKKESKKAISKLRGIRALNQCYFGKINKRTIKDLKFARNNLKDKEMFDNELVEVFINTDQPLEGFEQDLNNTLNYDNYESGINYILENSTSNDFKKIIDSFINKIEVIDSYQKNKLIEVVKGIISKLHEEKNYSSVIDVSKYFSESFLEKADVLFETACANSQNGIETTAKKLYERIWDKKQDNSAVANNLALLYEDENDFMHAEELLKKAVELNPDDEIGLKNLERINQKVNDELKDILKWDKEQKKGLEKIKDENVYVHQKILYLMDFEDEKKHIIATQKQLVEILRTSPEKGHELINSLLKKNYIGKIKNHNINTLSNVYSINHLVREYIIKYKKDIERNIPLSIIGEKINIESFKNLGYDYNLLSKIDSKIANKELRGILKRDLKENTFALITESYKTALVISGSIIESIILDKVLNSGINTHFPNIHAKKKKNIIKMDLSELLFTANSINAIEIQLYHFSQALKQYRNLIHPAVEIRKGKIKKITKVDAKLAWDITKKVIFEI